ncbi:type II toxin-antitoxin system RelE/ParE family toxin [Rhodopirellula europaea]|uniref:type II toxin-antitoxin system RelE/ParE family toxin n=1 Tax=Rhodopirellula europaea TaxID=1263866 RepID=UPI003D27769A
MIVNISSDAEADIADGFWFYEGQNIGLGDYFRSSIIADIDSLAIYGGIHEQVYGYHRLLSRRFPFTIYYRVDQDVVLSRLAGMIGHQHVSRLGDRPGWT